MAKIQAVGDAYVLTADIKMEDIRSLKKFGRTSALQLVDSETKQVYFKVDEDGEASATKYGVCFTSEDEEGMATATFAFPKLNMKKAEKQTIIRNKFAPVLANLALVTKQVAAEKTSLDKAIAELDAATTIA